MKKITFLVLTLALFFNSYAIDTLNVNITSDTTLTADTIYVPHGIVVDTGIVLTINAGVTMLFNGDTTYNVMENTEAGYILVSGSIVAIGDANNRIVFSKNDSLKWGGIFLNNAADYSMFKYCDFSYGNMIDSLGSDTVSYNSTLVLLNDSVDFYSCHFSYNEKAIYASHSSFNLFNGIIDNNVYGITADSSEILIGNTTITANTTGIMLNDEANAVISSSIVYGNTTGQLEGSGNFTYDVTYSDIEGYFAGTGNYAIDPEFANTTNFKLSPCSGIINKGNTSPSYMPDTLDFYGNTRIFYLVPDMGAYEHQYPNSYVSNDTIQYGFCEGDSVLVDGVYYNNDTILVGHMQGINYCDSSFINNITEFPMPIITFDVTDTTVCLNTNIVVNALVDEAYLNPTFDWASSDTLESVIKIGDGILARMLMPKTYYVTVTAEGCVAVDSTNIQLHPEIIVELGNDSTVCRRHKLDAGAGYASYSWNTYESTNEVEVLETMTYIVTVTDSYGCTLKDQVAMTLLSSPVVEFTDDTMKMTTDDTRIIGGAGLGYPNYLWNTSETTSRISVVGLDLGIGTYTYWQTSEFTNGCKDSDTLIVVVTDGVGIIDIEGVKNLKIYPNPSTGIVNLDAEFDNANDIKLSITDISGRIVFNKDIDNTTFVKEQIDLSSNNKGIYFINILVNNKTLTYRISIQ